MTTVHVNFDIEKTASNKLQAQIYCNSAYLSVPDVVFELHLGSNTTIWIGCSDKSLEIENTCLANSFVNLTTNLGSGCYILKQAKCPGN